MPLPAVTLAPAERQRGVVGHELHDRGPRGVDHARPLRRQRCTGERAGGRRERAAQPGGIERRASVGEPGGRSRDDRCRDASAADGDEAREAVAVGTGERGRDGDAGRDDVGLDLRAEAVPPGGKGRRRGCRRGPFGVSPRRWRAIPRCRLARPHERAGRETRVPRAPARRVGDRVPARRREARPRRGSRPRHLLPRLAPRRCAVRSPTPAAPPDRRRGSCPCGRRDSRACRHGRLRSSRLPPARSHVRSSSGRCSNTSSPARTDTGTLARRRPQVGSAGRERFGSTPRAADRAKARPARPVVPRGNDDERVERDRSGDGLRQRAVGERRERLGQGDQGDASGIVRVAVPVGVHGTLETGDQLVGPAVDRPAACRVALPAGDANRQHGDVRRDARGRAGTAQAGDDPRHGRAVRLQPIASGLLVVAGRRAAVEDVEAGQHPAVEERRRRDRRQCRAAPR